MVAPFTRFWWHSPPFTANSCNGNYTISGGNREEKELVSPLESCDLSGLNAAKEIRSGEHISGCNRNSMFNG